MIIAKKYNNKEQELFEHSKNVYESLKKENLNMESFIPFFQNDKAFYKNVLKEDIKNIPLFLKEVFFFISFFHDLGKGCKDFVDFINEQKNNENWVEHQFYSYFLLCDLNMNIPKKMLLIIL